MFNGSIPQLPITRGYVVLLPGRRDACTLVAQLPGPRFLQDADGDPLKLDFRTLPGEGIAYMRRCFPDLSIEVTDARVTPARVYMADHRD